MDGFYVCSNWTYRYNLYYTIAGAKIASWTNLHIDGKSIFEHDCFSDSKTGLPSPPPHPLPLKSFRSAIPRLELKATVSRDFRFLRVPVVCDSASTWKGFCSQNSCSLHFVSSNVFLKYFKASEITGSWFRKYSPLPLKRHWVMKWIGFCWHTWVYLGQNKGLGRI